MTTPKPLLQCTSCKVELPLTAFAQVSETPLRYSDICARCVSATKSPATTVKRELARRRLMRDRLLYFTVQMHADYKAGWVHNDVARRLERFMRAVERKESPRLMLFLPPRLGKSTLASDMFPSWALGHHPTWEFILSSYSVGLPTDFSRNIRTRLQSNEYAAVFPDTKLRKDSQNVERWLTTMGGGLLAVGVGGGSTGRGAHIFVIDDPIKDYEDALSETVRATAYNWYHSVAKMRLAPGGGVLIIQTRWHDKDLSGWLLEDQQRHMADGLSVEEFDNWEVVSYPQLAEDDEYLLPDGSIYRGVDPVEGARLLRRKGEALHPERYSTQYMLRMRNDTPPQIWEAQQQQNPIPPSGDKFSRDMFRFTPQLEYDHSAYRFFLAGDLALGQKRVNDWTVLVVGALDGHGNITVVDMVRARLKAPEIIATILELAKKWPLMKIGIEHGQISMAIMGDLRKGLNAQNTHVPFDDKLIPVTDKEVRAAPLQFKAQSGRLIFVSGQPWVDTAINELLRFPNGAHDDVVDALAWLVRMSASIPPPVYAKSKSKVKRWRDALSVKSHKSFMAA